MSSCESGSNVTPSECDFLALDDHDSSVLMMLINRAQELKSFWDERRMPSTLTGRRVALIVDDNGWRNTTAFDLGCRAMGALCVHTPAKLTGSEVIADLAGYLDNWFDAVVARTPSLASLRELAQAARAPVINARTRTNHPCETLGDLSFIWCERGSLEELRVGVVSPDTNILRSWIEASAVLPVHVTQVYPKTWHASGRANFLATDDMAALNEVNVLVTDCWPRNAKPETMLPYQITGALLDRLNPQLLFLPCPPVTRAQEVSVDAMLNRRCRVSEAKAYLLHAQNAVLERWAKT